MAACMWKKILCQGCRSFPRHGFCTSSSRLDSLRTPLSGLPPPIYASPSKEKHVTHVTKLENGLRVASEDKYGQFCTVGVVIDSGSRYEVNYPSGISHFLEKLAYSRTVEYESHDKIQQELEQHSGIFDCQSSRDTLIYAMSSTNSGLPTVLNILSEVVHRPQITAEELEVTRASVGFELEDIHMNPKPDLLISEMIHAAAYRNNTLGLPKLCPTENLARIDARTLYSYMRNYHTPERMVLAGVGMPHDELVELARQHFISKTPVWETGDVDASLPGGRDQSLSQYTGGLVKVQKDLSNIALGPTPEPDLAHVAIGLESCSHKHEDFVAYCVLNMMLGGGTSFSSGGPGKGMYTRLYLNALNRYQWLENLISFNQAYEDSGLFFLFGSAPPDKLEEMTKVIITEMRAVGDRVNPVELNRAKIQLQSILLMNLEQRPVVFEDIGRQVLANNARPQPEYYSDLIDKVTEKDIQRIVYNMLRTKPAVAAYGDLKKLPSLDHIQDQLAGKSRMSRRFSIFNR